MPESGAGVPDLEPTSIGGGSGTNVAFNDRFRSSVYGPGMVCVRSSPIGSIKIFLFAGVEGAKQDVEKDVRNNGPPTL